MDRVHAWDQPAQPADIYSLPGHFGVQAIEEVVSGAEIVCSFFQFIPTIKLSIR